MKPPIYVVPLTPPEHRPLEAARRSSHAFRVRRAQIVLASAQGHSAKPIAQLIGCSVQTVRHVIRAFNVDGLACLAKQSNRPKSAKPMLDASQCEPLRPLLHQSPRRVGKSTGLWTLALVAQVCHEHGLSARRLSEATVRRALKRLGANRKRAKHWLTSPDPQYASKKNRRDRLRPLAHAHPEWGVGFADDVWWSRLAHPHLHAWTDSEPLRLVQQVADTYDPDSNALACYGVWRVDTQVMLLRFVDGRPVSHVTTQFLRWLAERVADAGKPALVVMWANASWHVSRDVRTWLKAHHQRGTRAGGCRLVRCQLPSKSPWLNRIEPKWVHGKRAIAEPTRKLTGQETRQRLCDDYHCELLGPLAHTVA